MFEREDEYGEHQYAITKARVKAMKEEDDNSDDDDSLSMRLYQAGEYFGRLHRKLEDLKAQQRKDIKRNPKEYLGYFEITSGQVMVSDPCYEIGTWCQHELDKVKNGKWMSVKVSSDEKDWGIRVAELYAYTGDEPEEEDFEHVEGASIGVDSGQAGIFDLSAYRNDKLIDINEIQNHFWRNENDEIGQLWYGACCDITSSGKSAGSLTGGVVSSSGYGDGGYDLYAVKDAEGLITAIKVVYIGDDEEEEEEE